MFLVEFRFLRESAREITSAHVEKHSVFFIRREYTIDAKIKIREIISFFFFIFLLHDYINYNTCYEFIHVTKSE